MNAPRLAASPGVAYALAAYGMWGVTPAYWKLLVAVPPAELLAHRILWSTAVGLILLALLRDFQRLRPVLRPRLLLAVVASALLLGCNWLTFLYAIETDRVLATSLGYYINPLVSVLLGGVFLGERLRPRQIAAVALAAAGVAWLTFDLGELPWIALVLCTSFALYGLARKLVPIAPLAGFAAEMALLAPLAGLYLLSLDAAGGRVFPLAEPARNALLAGSGAVTAAPLLCFASAAQRVRLTTLGLCQYVAPSIAFLLAVEFFGEPFTRGHAVCFACVWTALGLYAVDSARAARGL